MEESEQHPPKPRANKEKVKRFRLTSGEVKAIEAKAKKAGLSFSEYCRRAALDKRIVELIPPELRRSITLAGSNLNQLTRLANAGKLNAVSAERLSELVTRLLETLK